MLTREQSFEQMLLGKTIKPEGWLGKLRLNAQSNAKALSFPSARHDDWRLTDLSALLQHTFLPVDTYAELTLEDIAPFTITGAIRLVFIDGSYSPDLSDTTQANEAIVVGALTERLGDPLIEKSFARLAGVDVDAFSALNTSNFDDGAWVQVNGEVSAPVHILNVVTKRDNPTAIYPRALVVMQPNSRATLIEDFVGIGAGISFSNAVTEIVLQDHAQLQHIRVQREAASAFHFGHCAVESGKGSVYTSTALAFGARVSRHEIKVTLAGEGAESTLNGLALIAGRQIADTHTRIDHTMPRCKSNQLHKCIADGSSHAIFSGKIIVREGASGTDSAQSSRNLLLSGKAHIDTQPQLEIFNDDVSCKHGATIGEIDADSLFFLQSRGLTEERARNLLTHAFAAEIIEKIPVQSLVESLSQTILAERMKVSV
ncbi:MAG: Fe-S cluster assembly protein SufD [Gallionella sp.]